MTGWAARVGAAMLAAAALVGVTATPSAAAGATLAPTYGPVATTVTITGSGLLGAKAVSFNGAAAAYTVDGDSQVTTTVPSGATTGPVTVTDSGGNPISAGTFTVQLPTTATIWRSARVVQFPHAVTIRSVLTAAGAPASGQPARLQRSLIGSGVWSTTGLAETTNSSGVVQWSFTPRRTLAYRVVFGSTPRYLGTTSPQTRAYVRPTVTVDIPNVAPILTTLRFTGTVSPAPSSGPVYLDRYYGGRWHRVAIASRVWRGHYAARTSLPATGTFSFRLRRPADATHLLGVSAAHQVLGVNRTLRQGMSGPDVLALQKRLRYLRYDTGAVDGHFGYDLFHAVVAFQKVQGLTRDGVVGPTVWRRVARPRLVKLLHPFASKAGVEVDLTHQIVIYGVDGHVRRILDASTGGGYYYTGSDGATHQAITPTGHFGIVYKRDGWVTAPLGTLYRPAYFNYDGYAIHGEGAVPSYPASHGCVRITVPAMDRFNAKLTIGLSVWIYRT